MKTLLNSKQKQGLRNRKKIRTKAKISNVAGDKAKLLVYRSNSFIYAQLMDTSNKILGSSSDLKVKGKGTKTEKAVKVGEAIATIAKTNKITEVVFDRNGFTYTGRIKALADGARSAGLKF